MTTYLTSWEAKDANTLRRRLSRRGLGELGPVLERQLGELDEQRHPLFQGKRLEPTGFLLFRFQASIVADERFHGLILPLTPLRGGYFRFRRRGFAGGSGTNCMFTATNWPENHATRRPTNFSTRKNWSLGAAG
jgi:hypothetical protein